MNGYPRNLAVDFSKLRPNTLKRYAWYYNVEAPTNNNQPELASACARHFSNHVMVNETQVLNSFIEYCHNPNAPSKKRGRYNGFVGKPGATGLGGGKRGNPASVGEEPASKKKRHTVIPEGRKAVSKINDNWMLTRVIKYMKRKKMYKVEDADEMAKDALHFEVHPDEIILLPTAEEIASRKAIPKHSRVLARFPKTTTFYAATVVKKIERGKKTPDYCLRFDDDERDATGEIRSLKVSALEVVETAKT
uniref:SGF29 C-terminal domain-containing protein n=1 Tax=Mucochytrium quahogii TaxID=96639 RepID=A0A7S2RMR3_9STRA|mmetsp:Transcript_6980/g.11067  ORF Transcript_6980/g.11067 Transcript_6980/m.11067 type:complete len:249 (+) Transcript_6980:225-971(+)